MAQGRMAPRSFMPWRRIPSGDCSSEGMFVLDRNANKIEILHLVTATAQTTSAFGTTAFIISHSDR